MEVIYREDNSECSKKLTEYYDKQHKIPLPTKKVENVSPFTPRDLKSSNHITRNSAKSNIEAKKKVAPFSGKKRPTPVPRKRAICGLDPRTNRPYKQNLSFFDENTIFPTVTNISLPDPNNWIYLRNDHDDTLYRALLFLHGYDFGYVDTYACACTALWILLVLLKVKPLDALAFVASRLKKHHRRHRGSDLETVITFQYDSSTVALTAYSSLVDVWHELCQRLEAGEFYQPDWNGIYYKHQNQPLTLEKNMACFTPSKYELRKIAEQYREFNNWCVEYARRPELRPLPLEQNQSSLATDTAPASSSPQNTQHQTPIYRKRPDATSYLLASLDDDKFFTC